MGQVVGAALVDIRSAAGVDIGSTGGSRAGTFPYKCALVREPNLALMELQQAVVGARLRARRFGNPAGGTMG